MWEDGRRAADVPRQQRARRCAFDATLTQRDDKNANARRACAVAARVPLQIAMSMQRTTDNYTD